MQEKSELVFINGNLTAFQCIEQLINPEVISLFVRKPNHVLMQDSARPHMAHLTATHLANLGIPVLPWPAKSDMNPIENLWGELEGSIRNRPNQTTSLQQSRGVGGYTTGGMEAPHCLHEEEVSRSDPC